MSFAHELSNRALSIRYETAPTEALHVARRAFADTIGVALAGSDTPVLGALEQVLNTGAAPGQATLWGRAGRRASILHAALMNATAAHALDFDDCSTTMGGHPSTPLVPVVLALAEANDQPLARALTAYLAGFETETRLARGLLPHHYEKGWHPTATLGVFGAAVAAGRMLDLDEGRMAAALAIATSMASGLKANFGTPIKPLQVGQAAHNGLLAALLASRGMTANPEAFEHEYGFFNLYNGAGKFDAAAILAGWDQEPEVLSPGIAVKQHPCCGSAHSAIDAALKIVAQAGTFAPEAIAGVAIRTHRQRLAHTDRARPRTGLDAKFSVQFLVAKALTSGVIRLADFDDASFLTPQVATVLPLVEARAHDLPDAYLGEVRVTLKDGRIFEATASTRFGRGPANPMSDAELRAKFVDCAGQRLADPAALFDRILGMDPQGSLSQLMRQIGG